ncbi:hypothetical protein Ahia01_000277300 [Argonauta hians]
MEKTLQDEKCELEIALAWAVSAKNALQNHSGHSPNELVFGSNINTPSVLIDQLPALDASTTSDMVRINLNALHSARKRFMEAESSEKIRRALRCNVRHYADEEFETGDSVYYKRQNYKGWRGPAKVLGKEGQCVLIRHGGAFYRMHPCHLMKVNQDFGTSKNKENTITFNEMNEVLEEEVEDQQKQNSNNNRKELKDNTTRPSKGKIVEYRIIGNEEWKKGKIMNTQPKLSGNYGHWRNVEPAAENESPLCVNWDEVDQWREVTEGDHEEHVVFLTAEQEQANDVINAKERELENMKAHEVYECVPNIGQKCISTRWVITEKVKDNKKVMKARLVARGYEENSHSLKTDSPTCSREGMRLVMLTASVKKWRVETLDFTSAFLQGDVLERELFLRPPTEACPESQVWKLKRCIYGLNDAPRSWYKRVTQKLIELKGMVSAYDNALFLWHDLSQNLTGILAMHVDDFIFCGNDSFKKNVISELKKMFKVGTHENGTFKFMGLAVKQTVNGIIVNQDKYVSSISPIDIKKGRSLRKNDELSQEEKTDLKRLTGQMMWVSTQTRPDVSFDVCRMSNTGKSPKVKLLFEANKSLLKLKSKTGSISFPQLGNPSDLSVVCYSDATYASLEDGSSQGGFIILVYDKMNRLAPICWSSKKLDRVTKSPLASETLALNEAADAGVLISAMLQEIFRLPKLPEVLCKTDNASLVETLKSSNLVSDRRLRIDVARVKEMIAKEEIQIQWIRRQEQIADCLTKMGASTEILF